MYFTVCIVLLCVLGTLHYCWRRRLWYLASKIPGLNGYPIVGIAPSLICSNEELLGFLRSNATTYYPTGKLWLGPWLFVSVSDQDDIETILKSKKCVDRKFFKAILDKIGAGDTLITTSGEKWARHRKVIIPTLKLSVIKTFISIFQIKSFELVENWASVANGSEMEIFLGLCHSGLQMTCSTLMGVNIEINNDKAAKFLNVVEYLKHFLVDLTRYPWLCIMAQIPFTKLAKKLKTLSIDINEFPKYIVRENISNVRKNILENANSKHQCKEKLETVKDCYLDYLVKSLLSESPVLSEKEINEETLIMILGGYETTATVNGFVIMLLALHPEIQNKAFQELLDIFGNDQIRPATLQDVQEMKYLEQIIKETLRLYPPLPIIPRIVEEEIKIKNYTLPVGTIVLINFLVAHRHPKSISNPDKFNPDNFSPNRNITRQPFAYSPFSVGLRACLGKNYAMLQMKVMLSTILRYYKILPVGELEDLDRLELGVTLKPKLGVRVRMIPREYNNLKKC